MFKSILIFLRFSLDRFNKRNKMMFFSVAITAALSLLAVIIVPILQRDIIENVQADIINHPLMVIIFFISIVGIFCAVYESLVFNKLNMSLQYYLHREMIASAVRYSSKVIASRGSGAYMSLVFGDSEQIAELLKTNYFSIILVLLQTAFITAIASSWSWIFVAVVAPIYVLSVLVIMTSNKIYVKHRAVAHEKVIKLNPKILERLENRLSVLGFADISSMEAELFKEFDSRDTSFIKAKIANDLSAAMVKVLAATGLVVLFILSMTQISSGNLSMASFVAMLSYYAVIFFPLSAVQNLTQGMGSFKMHYNRIKDDLTKMPIIGLPKSCELKFVECSFGYDEGTSGQITNLSMSIDRRIGLVGLSGEGKTTVIKILLGTILPQKGTCLLGGIDISGIAKGVLHSMIRLYSQDLELFNDTLAYNITLEKTMLNRAEYSKIVSDYETRFYEEFSQIEKGKAITKNCETIKELFLLNDWQIRNPELLQEIATELKGRCEMFGFFSELIVARKFYIAERYHSILEDLGLTHLTDRPFGQHGKNVSGGEKNKICLARFLLPVQKSFYIIDEPFTAVDAVSEEKCINAVKKYLDCKGGIIISHKLNVVRVLSNDIVVLNKGKIFESGTHDMLIQNKGLYADLYNKFIELK